MSSHYSVETGERFRGSDRAGGDVEHDVFVRRLSALYPLQPHEIKVLETLVESAYTVPPHQDILKEQQPAKEALVLLEGLACHYKVLDSARRQMTGFVLPGDLCDYGFLSSSVTRQSVLSLGQVVIGRIDLRQLSAVADKMPNILVAAMRAASIDQSCARELIISLGARDALQRLAHFLCEHYYRLRTVALVSANNQFELAMTQAELGEALGLSTVHINRTIQQLRKRKLISMGHGMVAILDLDGLEAIASFDGRYLRPN
jgi:CRP-like cAMP-binding protein